MQPPESLECLFFFLTETQLLAMGFYAATFLALKDGMGKSVDVITEAERAEMSRVRMHLSSLLNAAKN